MISLKSLPPELLYITIIMTIIEKKYHPCKWKLMSLLEVTIQQEVTINMELVQKMFIFILGCQNVLQVNHCRSENNNHKIHVHNIESFDGPFSYLLRIRIE